jgi:hypothetical protein
VIAALTGDAGEALGIASITRAIVVDIAFLSVGAGSTYTSTAIEVRLSSIQAVIAALTGNTSVG